jgi:hypothetical protein
VRTLGDVDAEDEAVAFFMPAGIAVDSILQVAEKVDKGSKVDLDMVKVEKGMAKTESEIFGQFDISQSMPDYRMPEFGLSIEFSKGKIDVNDDRLCLTPINGMQRKWYRHDLTLRRHLGHHRPG